MAIEHDAIPDSELHEPKGASAALSGQVYTADGLGSGSFQYANTLGSIYYKDFTTGTTVSTPSSYTLMAPATTTSKLVNFSQNSLGRLTYTGTADVHAIGKIQLIANTSTSSDLEMIIYKNGVVVDIHEYSNRSTGSVKKNHELHFDMALSENDYLEVYVKASSGSVTIHGFYFTVQGLAI